MKIRINGNNHLGKHVDDPGIFSFFLRDIINALCQNFCYPISGIPLSTILMEGITVMTSLWEGKQGSKERSVPDAYSFSTFSVVFGEYALPRPNIYMPYGI